jgi:hypothetical protein
MTQTVEQILDDGSATVREAWVIRPPNVAQSPEIAYIWNVRPDGSKSAVGVDAADGVQTFSGQVVGPVLFPAGGAEPTS